jgi:hypothetical protein
MDWKMSEVSWGETIGMDEHLLCKNFFYLKALTPRGETSSILGFVGRRSPLISIKPITEEQKVSRKMIVNSRHGRRVWVQY